MESQKTRPIDAPFFEWRHDTTPVDYPAAVAVMERRARDIRDAGAGNLVWMLEHPPLYTAGTSADPADLLAARFPVHATGRGGQYTYHGPGQRVCYVVADLLRHRKPSDLRGYIHDLEQWMINALADFDVRGERRAGRVGIWVDMAPYGAAGTECKIAAIGVRVRRWVAYHGVALNVTNDLDHYRGIVPCGIAEHGVTSLAALGVDADMAAVDCALKKHFIPLFG